jgi:hypothetical protein
MFSEKAIQRVKVIDKKIEFVDAIVSDKGIIFNLMLKIKTS